MQKSHIKMHTHIQSGVRSGSKKEEILIYKMTVNETCHCELGGVPTTYSEMFTDPYSQVLIS